MFPTESHKHLVEYAFKSGRSQLGEGGGGLSDAEVKSIDFGSRLTDTLFGTGQMFNWTPPHIDPAITLIVSEAPKHAMTPGDMSVEAAQEEANKWIRTNTSKAWAKQREACMKHYDASRLNLERSRQSEALHSQRNDGRPIPAPHPIPVPSRKLEGDALTDFGRACHTYMDACSPAHYGWQRYKMPMRTAKITDPETGIVVGELETYDWVTFALEGLAHKKAEEEPPTAAQRDEAVLYMRAAFLTTFGNWWFSTAVRYEKDRNGVYDFLKQRGLSWKEDIIPKQDGFLEGAVSLTPPRFASTGFRHLG